jgi:hypothetical protein
MEESAVNWTEWAVKRVFFWEEDETKVGKLVRAIHAGFTYMMLLLIALSFTLIPAFWFQTILLCIAGVIWVHHILFHGCVCSKVEQRLLKDETSFLDPYLGLFGVEANELSLIHI